MKEVRKLAEPAQLVDWKAQANDDWKPSYEVLQNPQKRVLHESLLAEQGYVCCYCGRSISLSDSHIEHFRPQESHEVLELDYDNLHASCIRETSPGSPLHCGHAKGNAFDEKLVVSPQEADCEKRFFYLLDGSIKPKHEADASANYMVGLLKLDIAFLRERREAALKGAFDDEFLESASNEELLALAGAYRRPEADGRMTDFGHVLARYAEQLLGQPA